MSGTLSVPSQCADTGALSWLGSNGATDPNSAIGNQGAQLLLTNITDTRNQLKALNLPKTIQVGTSDAGSYFNKLVLQAVDYGVGVECLGVLATINDIL